MKPKLAAFCDVHRYYPIFISILTGKIRVNVLMILKPASMLIPKFHRGFRFVHWHVC